MGVTAQDGSANKLEFSRLNLSYIVFEERLKLLCLTLSRLNLNIFFFVEKTFYLKKNAFRREYVSSIEP